MIGKNVIVKWRLKMGWFLSIGEASQVDCGLWDASQENGQTLLNINYTLNNNKILLHRWFRASVV